MSVLLCSDVAVGTPEGGQTEKVNKSGGEQ